MEAEKVRILKMIMSVIISGFVVFVFHVYNVLVVKPQRLRSKLQNQGIRGPSPSLLLGNISEMRRIVQHQPQTQTQSTQPAISHDCPSTVFAYLQKWRNEYGTHLSSCSSTSMIIFLSIINYNFLTTVQSFLLLQ